ncbi:putative nuclease HARBI1 [Heterodontus francisci]|uniref:putative nuclease HARBI1 n=1 Tax=Heterodontus francisci TaxID=7792 RepID=UPI00355C0DBD
MAWTFFVSDSFQGIAADLSGILQKVARHCILLVTDALFARFRKYIYLVTDMASQGRRALGFTIITRFPEVQGIIDCSHVTIKAPSDQPTKSINRKGFYSLNIQQVCNNNKSFIHVCAHFPGSCHDSFILHQSSLPQIFTPSPKEHALGNRGNPLKKWLLTRLWEPQIQAQRCYKQGHLPTRTAIEQAIGLLKRRFRCMDQWGGPVQYPPTNVSVIVVVCCTFHNMALQRDVHFEDIEGLEEDSLSEEKQEQEVREEEEMEAEGDDTAQRDAPAAQQGG